MADRPSYLRLLSKYYQALAEIKRLRQPQMPEEEREKRLLQIKSYFSTGNQSRLALTAANLYNAGFFDTIDPAFGRQVAAFLVEQFAPVSGLIEESYQLWEEKLNG